MAIDFASFSTHSVTLSLDGITQILILSLLTINHLLTSLIYHSLKLGFEKRLMGKETNIQAINNNWLKYSLHFTHSLLTLLTYHSLKLGLEKTSGKGNKYSSHQQQFFKVLTSFHSFITLSLITHSFCSLITLSFNHHSLTSQSKCRRRQAVWLIYQFAEGKGV